MAIVEKNLKDNISFGRFPMTYGNHYRQPGIETFGQKNTTSLLTFSHNKKAHSGEAVYTWTDIAGRHVLIPQGTTYPVRSDV